MRLRQIKLSGFKSFADPTLIELHAPFVGIVGPNGCGKSNVIDAVRWVLGEGRLSELRGANGMADLIFSGSSGRAPMGRASVELVLDNRDGTLKGPWAAYAELSIKRVVTAEGDSGYFINHQQVRRRDVQEIFLGTGLGARSYAIISQGMIQNFIRAKPEELRGYLEEAAGVSLYKERRRETETLLRSTLENLERAEDLQTVRSEEIARLRSDAETAARWQELTERKEASEALWYFLQCEDAKNDLDRVRAEGASKAAELEERRAALAEAEAERETLVSRALEAEHASKAADERERAAERELARLEGEAKRIVEARRSAEAHLERAEAAAAEKTERLEAEAQAARLAQEEIEALEIESEETEAFLCEAEEALESAGAELLEAESARRAETERLEAARRRASADETALTHAKGRLEEIRRHAAKLSGEAESVEESRPDTEEGVRIEETLREAQAAEEEVAQLLEEAEVRLEEAEALRTTADGDYFSLLTEVKTASSRLSALQEIQAGAENRESFADWMTEEGLDGLPELADDISVDPGCLTAVEAVLGVRVRAFLLRDLRTAAGFEAKRPPASLTFAAPDLQIESEGGRIPDLPEGCRPLLECVRVRKPAARSALVEWLRGALLVSGLDAALGLRARLPEGAFAVTEKGDVVTRSSVTFFASEAPENSLLSRSQEIRRLTDALETLEERLIAADEARTAAKDRAEGAKRTADEARRQAAAAQRRLSEARAAHSAFAARFDAWARREEDLRRSRAELEAEIREREAHLETLLEGAEESRGALEAVQAREAELLRREGTARNAELRASKRAADAKERSSLLALRLRQARESAVARARLSADLEADRLRERARADEARRTLARLDEETADADAEGLLEELARLNEEASRARDALERARRTLAANETVTRELQGAMLPLTESIGALLLEEGQKKALLEQLSGRLDELGADRVRLSVTAQERHVKAGTVRSEVQRLMAEIAGLGAVNHAALAHLSDAERVFAQTGRQMDDLREAAATLEAAVRRIDAETRSRMRETFDRVNANFAETFAGLFGGGNASLAMVGDEILSAGIEVTAQPPGKRNASVRALSGGEQALTATALVFAMFRLNPAPFCLLDEVDAPLDEANQARLAGLCLSMSEETQFLIITHHRVTMEFASALIGVTMREPGVSRVVSVDIDEALRFAESQRAQD